MQYTRPVSSRVIRRALASVGALALVASALAQQAATSDLGTIAFRSTQGAA